MGRALTRRRHDTRVVSAPLRQQSGVFSDNFGSSLRHRSAGTLSLLVTARIPACSASLTTHPSSLVAQPRLHQSTNTEQCGNGRGGPFGRAMGRLHLGGSGKWLRMPGRWGIWGSPHTNNTKNVDTRNAFIPVYCETHKTKQCKLHKLKSRSSIHNGRASSFEAINLVSSLHSMNHNL